MRKGIYWVLAVLMASFAWSATPARKTVGKKAASKATRKVASKSGKKTAPQTATTWRNRQTAPTPERYREIKDALATRGYLDAANAGGNWDQNSVEALKRFQTDQNLEANGKINSLSLIALGLGPAHRAPAAATPQP
jgi:hypothetical protein